MLTDLIILGAGVMLGVFITNKAKNDDYKVMETPESMIDDCKRCLDQVYEDIKDISIDDIRNSMMSKYKKIKKKIDSIDLEGMKDKGCESMQKMKTSIMNLKKEVLKTKEN